MEKPFKFGKYKGQTPSEVAQSTEGRSWMEYIIRTPYKFNDKYSTEQNKKYESESVLLKEELSKILEKIPKAPMVEAVRRVYNDSLPSTVEQQEVFLLEKISSQLDVITTLLNQKLLE